MGLKSGPQKTATPPGTGGCCGIGVRSVDSAGRARAMTIRIAASILVIYAAGGFIAPGETSAQGWPFDGGRTAPHSARR